MLKSELQISVVIDSSAFENFPFKVRTWSEVHVDLNKVCICKRKFEQLEILIICQSCTKNTPLISSSPWERLIKHPNLLTKNCCCCLSASSFKFLLCNYHMKRPHNCTRSRNRKFYVIFDTLPHTKIDCSHTIIAWEEKNKWMLQHWEHSRL